MMMLLEAFFPIPPTPPRRQSAYPIPSWIPGTSVPAIFWITYTWYQYPPGGGGGWKKRLQQHHHCLIGFSIGQLLVVLTAFIVLVLVPTLGVEVLVRITVTVAQSGIREF